MNASEVNTLLDFSKRDCREISLTKSWNLQPSKCSSVGIPLAHLRRDIGVNQKTNQSNTGGLRDLPVPRFGIGISNRGPSPSKTSFQFLASPAFDFCHSSMETTTAVSTPRRATICGPFSTASSTSSLERALACCNCHLAVGLDLMEQ